MSNNNPDNLKPKNPSTQGFSKEHEHYLHLCHVVFEQNDKGAEWLKFMKESLIDKLPTADPSKGESHAYYREGQNSIIRSIYQNKKAYEEEITKNNRSGD